MNRTGRGREAPPEERGEGTGAPAVVSRWEWVAAALSSLLVLAVIGTLIREALAGPPTPPDIRIVVERVSRAGDFHLVEFRALNSGRTTAAGLEVEGELKAGDRVVETRGATIDYVPAGSSRRAGLFFSADPRRFTLEVYPTGFDWP